MPIAPRPSSIGRPLPSNITSYFSNRRTRDPPSASLALAAAKPDSEPDSPVAEDSAPEALCRIQTGQNSLSAVAKNFVPQTRQVRTSSGTDPGFVAGSSTGYPDSVFTASAICENAGNLIVHHRKVAAWAVSACAVCKPFSVSRPSFRDEK